ncbi:small ribosomal subunit protein mS35 [Aulostomus maculatus]
MATHRSKALLILARIHFAGLGLQGSVSRVTYATSASANPSGRQGFPKRGRKDSYGTARKFRKEAEPRAVKMPVDQDWPTVCPVAIPFRATAIPLPVRMGYPVKGDVSPEKKGNLELVKIPNFLHLTPAAIKKHCEALKPFCTQWPSALDTDAKCDQLFPIKVESRDYVFAGPSVRTPKACVIHLRVKLSSLNLDEHARKKMVKLVGERYCQDTDVLTIKTDSCPLRQQNHDYAMYLLTVLYHESWKTEAWEAQKTVADMEEYGWENSPSQKNILETLVRMKVAGQGDGEEVREQLLGRTEVQRYKDSVTRLKNEGPSESSLLQYKEAVKKILSL